MSKPESSVPFVPPVRSSRITINLSPELHHVLRGWASDEGRSVSNLCRQLIEASIALRNRRP